MARLGEEPRLDSAHLDPTRVDSFDRYPFRLPAVWGLDRIRFHPEVTFLVGENGSGKSTPCPRPTGGEGRRAAAG